MLGKTRKDAQAVMSIVQQSRAARTLIDISCDYHVEVCGPWMLNVRSSCDDINRSFVIAVVS